MIPLRLTWHLVSPMVVSGFPLHLDALIAYAIAEEGRRQDPTGWDEHKDLELPLQRAEQGDETCWKASALTPIEPGAHAMRFWTKKSDPYDYAERLAAGQIDVKTKFPLKPYALKFDQQRGQFKQMFKWLPVRHVAMMQAWCIGDIDRISELLSPQAGLITYLGAKTRMGYGRIGTNIEDFNIEVDESAHEHWKRRVLPWPSAGCVEIEAATRPPYWDIQNRRNAWVNPDIYN